MLHLFRGIPAYAGKRSLAFPELLCFGPFFQWTTSKVLGFIFSGAPAIGLKLANSFSGSKGVGMAGDLPLAFRGQKFRAAGCNIWVATRLVCRPVSANH